MGDLDIDSGTVASIVQYGQHLHHKVEIIETCVTKVLWWTPYPVTFPTLPYSEQETSWLMNSIVQQVTLGFWDVKVHSDPKECYWCSISEGDAKFMKHEQCLKLVFQLKLGYAHIQRQTESWTCILQPSAKYLWDNPMVISWWAQDTGPVLRFGCPKCLWI